jgi:hypothetical protein
MLSNSIRTLRRADYLLRYRRIVSSLIVTPSPCCSILASRGHWSPRLTPSFKRRVASRDAKGGRGLPAQCVSSTVPVVLARRHPLSTALTVAFHSCAALRALPSRSASWTRRRRLASTPGEGGSRRTTKEYYEKR